MSTQCGCQATQGLRGTKKRTAEQAYAWRYTEGARGQALTQTSPPQWEPDRNIPCTPDPNT